MRFPELPGYRYEALLDEDSFGWTFVASHEGGERRAVRVFKAQATSDRLLYPYFKALSDPARRFPGIDPVYHHSLQDAKGPAACAAPFHGWKSGEDWQIGSLRRLMGMLSRAQALEVIRDLANALENVHRVELFHGGLRPSNIHLAPGAKGGQQALVSGLGQMFVGGLQFLEAGEFLFYASPEQLATGDFNGGMGKRWDVYAFGVIAFQALTGHLPRLDQLRCYNEENPTWLGDLAAITFGEITEVTEHFLKQLEEERSVEWPTPSLDAQEEALRRVIGNCLEYGAAGRPASMVEVAPLVREACLLSPSPFKAERADLPVSPAEKTVEVDEGIGSIFGEEPRRSSRRRKSPFPPLAWLERFRTNPALRWQIAALGSMSITLILTGIALFNFIEERNARSVAEVDLQRERQSGFERQAAAYSRMQAERARNSNLTAEINEVEDSKNNLLGQVKLARQLQRETQENGDRFFRLVLDNRDSDVPGFREGRAEALEEGRQHYERLVETYGDAPDFIVSTSNAFFYLGRIYEETGEFGKSLAAFGEAVRRYAALLENESTAEVEFVENIALAKGALGELAMRNGQHSVARHYFTESSRFWTEVRSRDKNRASEAALRIHENSLAIVETEFAMDRPDVALDAASSVGVALAAMQKTDPDNHRVLGALAKSFSLVGRVLESRGEDDSARKAYQQSSDLYAEAVRRDAAVDEYQLGLGNSLARVGLLSNDVGKLEGAAEVLGRVVAGNPYESIYLKTLADIYGALAVAQRDGGKMKNSIALEVKAIAILKPIVEKNKAVGPDVKHSYSQRLAHLAELLGDSGKFDESRVPLREAIALLESIADGEEGSSEYRRTLARTLGLAGFACLQAGDKGEAKEHLELARSKWQSYMASYPDDDSAAQAVKWTSEQLKSLQ